MTTVKEINHDSSTTLSDFYSTISDPDGSIAVTGGAALNGSTYGLDADYDAGTNQANLRESFTAIATDEFRARFYIDLSQGIAGTATSAFFSHSIWNSSTGDTFGQFQVRFDVLGDIEANLFYDDDVAASQNIGWVSITKDVHCIEYRVVRESSSSGVDGEVEFYIDNVSQGSVTTVENFNIWANVDDHIISFLQQSNVTGTLYYDEFILDNDDQASLGCGVAPGNLSLASMTKPADIDAAGEYIYLALLEGGTPILTKIATDLLSDGTTVFDPGAGDNIGVQCGKFDSDVVWIAGNFGGTDTVEKSENGGASFVVKDDGTFDPVTSFVVGPDSDDRVLIFEETGGTSAIQETTDSGVSWDEKNSALGFVSKAVERLDVNVEELVTGNEAGANDNIHYSPNTGEDVEDYSTGFPTQDVTQIIVN